MNTEPKPTEIDVELCKEFLARVISRNEQNPIQRNAGRLQYLKMLKDLDERPYYHMMGGLDLGSKGGLTFEIGLHVGLTAALSARGGAESYENLKKFVEGIRKQQEEEEKT